MSENYFHSREGTEGVRGSERCLVRTLISPGKDGFIDLPKEGHIVLEAIELYGDASWGAKIYRIDDGKQNLLKTCFSQAGARIFWELSPPIEKTLSKATENRIRVVFYNYDSPDKEQKEFSVKFHYLVLGDIDEVYGDD